MKEYILVDSGELKKKINAVKNTPRKQLGPKPTQFLYFIDKTGSITCRKHGEVVSKHVHKAKVLQCLKKKGLSAYLNTQPNVGAHESFKGKGGSSLGVGGAIRFVSHVRNTLDIGNSTNLAPELYGITQQYSAIPSSSISSRTGRTHVLVKGTNRALVLKSDVADIGFRTEEQINEDRLVKISDELYKAKSKHVNKEALLLVHGWSGNARETWGRFPDLLDSIGKYDVYLYNYPTSLFPAPNRILSWLKGAKASPSPRDISRAMKTTIDVHLSRYKRFHILAHSMGGVIARDYVANEIISGKQNRLKVGGLILFGSPFDGTQWDALCNLIGGQLVNLSADDDYLLQLQSDWCRHVTGIDWEVGRNVRMRLPTYAIVGTQDDIVTRKSASLYANRIRSVTASHVGLVKPSSRADTVFKATVSLLGKIDSDLRLKTH